MVENENNATPHICKEILEKNEVVFITRINKEKAIEILKTYEQARFHEEANCLLIGNYNNKINTTKKVAIISLRFSSWIFERLSIGSLLRILCQNPKGRVIL